MSITDDIASDVAKIADATFSVRKGQVVPTTEDVGLLNGAVELNAAYLYADLANSSKMARAFDRRVTAKILKSFLATATRLIRYCDGAVMSFDGDRVMGAFLGNGKCSNATKCALAISWAVENQIRPKFEKKYSPVRDAEFKIKHATGIDVGTVYIVRGGARRSAGGRISNDLISIGRAPNLAAKLSDIRVGSYSTFVTGSVFNAMNAKYKTYLNSDKRVWERGTWNFIGDEMDYYRTSYWRTP